MGNNSHLTVYKASAGSGKTFRLAVQYITMLIRHPEDYRSILAVTFTNKATAEMKQRILSQLYGIAHGLKSSKPYYDEVKASVTLTEQTIQHNAALALEMILQDYGSFRVETIDSFFQSVLRGLARELGIGGNLTLELDVEAAIDEAVDAFLAHVEPDTPDKRNIMKFVESKIENDKNWSIAKTVKDFSQELFSEIFMERGQELRRILTDNPDAVTDYKQNLVTARDTALPRKVEQIKEVGQQIKTSLEAVGSCIEDMGANAQKITVKILDGTVVDADIVKNVTLPNCATDPEKIFNKPIIKKSPFLFNLAQDTLMPLFAQVVALHKEYHRIKNSFECAQKYLHELSLLLSIRHEIDAQSQEQGRFLLADTPQLLHQMEDGDTSFIYEKTGSFTRHIMIDEFQDTSDLQWRNLYLLMNECLSIGQDCLVVGDVKQSIYRWRNSDWNILNTGIVNQFARYNPQVETMVHNRRSRQQVIDFNNTLFSRAVGIMSQFYKEQTGLEYPDLESAYRSVEQQCTNRDNTGYVYAQIITQKIEAKQLLDTVCLKIAEQLDRLTAAGVLQTDIAILCRKNERIADIAGWFAQNRPEYNMISSEAFLLNSSVTIRILIDAMRWLSDSTDRIALAQLAWEYACANASGQPFDRIYANGLENALPQEFIVQAQALRHLPLYELTEKLYGILQLDRIEGQDQYMMAFQDTLCQWLSHNPGELSEFLNEWDEELYKTKIPAADVNGIRMLTIHKSKGLEFHTVIVPFCDWPIINLNSLTEKRLWIQPQEQPYDSMPFIPVGFNSTLANSVFEDFYKTEAGLQTVDSLNLLYVALTRAISNLIILCSHPRRNTICETLATCLSTAFASTIDNEAITYETGQICPHIQPTNTDSSNPFDARPAVSQLELHTYPINARFRQSGESTRFVHSTDDDAERQEEYIQTGKLMHSLFATIGTEADIDPQVDQMLRDGLLESGHKAEQLKQDIRKHISATPGAKDWFNGNYSLFNEASIIYRDGGILQTRRPDRVMIKPDGTAIVVDFKFGREKEDYLHQVQEYMDLLRKMGHTQVEGYIWYVYNNKIQTI